jgi:diguanylate cyclase (GGDEF)-like protein
MNNNSGKSIEVLIIEDNSNDQLLVKKMLEKTRYASFEIRFMGNLAAGINEATQNNIDVILLDLNLPDSSGFETLLKLKLKIPDAPIVVFSGFEDEEESLKAVRGGAQDYLVKGRTDGNSLIRSLLYAIERKKAGDMIKYLAYHDCLTGLPSRTLFKDRFAMSISNSLRDGKKAALMLLDLDHFKEINDNLGHDAGDELLKEFSNRFVNTVRLSDTVCRLGGDEFALLMSDVSGKEIIEEVALRMLKTMRKPFIIQGREKIVTASMGIALHPEDGENLETLIKRADVAMYEVKRSGGNNYRYYQACTNTLEPAFVKVAANLPLSQEAI